MNIIRKIALVLAIITLQVSILPSSALALEYEYVPGVGMVPIDGQTSSYPQGVSNDGLFGMSVDDFRYMCLDTGGQWDIVNGRHVCYCLEGGEFNYPYGCPVVINYSESSSSQDPEPVPDSTSTQPQNPYNPYDPYGQYNPYDPYNQYGQQYPPYPEEPVEPPVYPEPDYDPEVDNFHPGYWDLYGHPAEAYVMELTRLGVIQGYQDGTFRPDNPVTRAEMTKMVMVAAKLQTLPCDEDRNRFFSDLDNWQAPWVNAAYRLDIVEGYTGGSSGVRVFKPNNWVNRAEGVKLVLAAFGRRPFDFDKISYVDVHDWMIPWVEDAYRIGLIDMGYDKRYYPAENMTRAFAAKVIYKMLQYSGDV